MVPGRLCSGKKSSLYRAKKWVPAQAGSAGWDYAEMAIPQPHQLGCVALSKLPTLSDLYHPSQEVMKIACGDLLPSSSRVSGTQEMHNTCSSSTLYWPLLVSPLTSPSTPHLTTEPSFRGSQAQTFQYMGQRQLLPGDSSEAPHSVSFYLPYGREGGPVVWERPSPGTAVRLG